MRTAVEYHDAQQSLALAFFVLAHACVLFSKCPAQVLNWLLLDRTGSVDHNGSSTLLIFV